MLTDIWGIYDGITGSKASEDLQRYGPESKLDYIQKILDKGWDVEFRFGSRLTVHSKLWIKRAWGKDREPLLRLYFSPNLDPSERQGRIGREGERMSKEFEERVKEYLNDKGIATPIEF